jgi:restriction endonuclease S subunit
MDGPTVKKAENTIMTKNKYKTWPTKKLGELLSDVLPGVWGEESRVSEHEVRAIKVSDIKEGGIINYESATPRSISNKEYRRNLLKKDDILIVKSSGSMTSIVSGRCALVENELSNYVPVNFILTLRADQRKLYPKYLYLFLTSPIVREIVIKMVSGSTYPNIRKTEYLNIEIPLPPIAEQRKIVARLESVLGKIKRAKRLREEAESAAEALLPAELYRIFTEHTAPHKQHPYKLENVGMSGGRQKWEEKELREVAELKTIKNTKTGLPFVGMEDVESATGKFLGSLESRSVRSTTFYFNNTSVLYGKLRPYLNKVLLPDFEGHCSTEFVPIKPKEGISREWIAYWLKSPQIVDGAMSTNTGSRMPRANMKDLIRFKIPLPTLAEQEKIVERLDALNEKIKKLREYQKSTAADFTALEQSVLHQAFN